MTFANISTGVWSSCGVTTEGAAFCWGSNARGELGDSSGRYESAIPVPVAGAHIFSQVSVGQGSACGVTTSGTGYCWGNNNFGELGVGVFIGFGGVGQLGCGLCSQWPVAVSGGLNLKTISHGEATPCGLTTSGNAYCWGLEVDDSALVGTGRDLCMDWNGDLTIPCSPLPVPVPGGLTFAGIGENSHRTCALTLTEAAYCWGSGYLGNGSGYSGTSDPVPLAGGLTFSGVSGRAGCGVTTDGVAYCWGNNDQGQLGDGSRTSSLVPAKVAGQP